MTEGTAPPRGQADTARDQLMSGNVYFPDVSAYQPGIDLSGWLAVIIKATEGTGWQSPRYAEQMAEAARHGAFAGAYHFLHSGNAQAQADFCYSVAGRGMPLMVDAEPAGSSKPGVADAAAFTDRYRALGGTVHLLYLPQWYWVQLGRPSLDPLARRGLHLVTSRYDAGSPEDPAHPGWQTYGGMPPVYTLQYTAAASVGGCRKVDLNCFRGSGSGDVAVTLAELKNLWMTGTLAGARDWTEEAIMALPWVATAEDITTRDLAGAISRDAPGAILIVHRVQHGINGIAAWNKLDVTLTVDGVYGDASKAAMREIQRFFGLADDGICGKATWRKLIGVL